VEILPGGVTVDEPDLQTLFDRLRHVCDALEQPNVALEEAMKLFEEGVALERRIRGVVTAAERRVVEVLKPDGGTEPFVKGSR
jgi:exodeoxyribonuclease VII small subunit